MTFSLCYGSGLWEKFYELGQLYIGPLVPTRRGLGILTNLSQLGSESQQIRQI
jgi:hypothetical protein